MPRLKSILWQGVEEGDVNLFSDAIVSRTGDFANQVDSLRFSCDCYIYNPLGYAWPMMETYIRRYLSQPVKTVFLGMNPGPFGMAQTGIPFGEITVVKEYLQIEEEIGRPLVEHPKRPVLGLATQRREVSGQRLWGLIQEYFPNAQDLVGSIAVINYCPLVFVDRGSSGKNITPDRLGLGERMALEAICDSYLHDMLTMLQPAFALGVGKYAENKLITVAQAFDDITVGSILHPSPINPKANQGWAGIVRAQLDELGVFHE